MVGDRRNSARSFGRKFRGWMLQKDKVANFRLSVSDVPDLMEAPVSALNKNRSNLSVSAESFF